MLEADHAIENLQHLWQRLGCKIKLAHDEADFFSVKGIQASGLTDMRQYSRISYRNKALLKHAERWSAIYAKDLSHSSVGFIHSEQLFPCEIVQICFLNGTKVDITIQRCRRLGTSCYECGGHIDQRNRLTVQIIRSLIQEQSTVSIG
jgi:hypothetical protein